MARVAHKYMAQEVSDREREATFAARQDILDTILTGLRDQSNSPSLRGWLLTGTRGAGKSTLVHMTRLRVSEDPKLRKYWLPVVLPEEQPNVLSLRDLWIAVLEQLADHSVSAKAAYQTCSAEPDDNKGEQLAVAALRELALSTGQRLILAIENFSDLLEVLGSDRKAISRFAKQLTHEPFAILLATSVAEIDLKNAAAGFAALVTPIPLMRVSVDEVWRMIEKRAAQEGRENLLTEDSRAKLGGIIAAITRLTGGNPRLVVMLYEIITVTNVDNAVTVLRQLMDDLTPLYDGLLRRLSAQQRKIVHALMVRGLTGEGITPAEIAEEARIDVLSVRTQLVRLRESGCISLEGGGKGREARYTVADRLFSTWYQMRYFKETRRRIEIFVEVLRVWFSPEERFREFSRVMSTHPLGRGEEHGPKYLVDSLAGTSHFEDANNRLEGEKRLEEYLQGASDELKSLCHATSDKYWVNDVSVCDDLSALLDRNDLPVYLRAMLLFRRGRALGKAGRLDEEIADYTRCIELPGSPVDRVACSYNNRGRAHGDAGRIEEEIADYTRCIELPGATVDQVAWSLNSRSVAHGQAGRHDEEIADCTRCIELPGSPVDQVAISLFNRGMAHGQAGRNDDAIADYTRCIELSEVPMEGLARSLINRGMTHCQAGRLKEAIADCNQCIELPSASEDKVAMSFYNRGCFYRDVGRADDAIADHRRVCQFPDDVLSKCFREWMNPIGILRQLARPIFRDRWPQIFQIATQHVPAKHAQRDQLEFFEPVARILQGEDRALLRKLAPEEREFAEEVLRRFDQPIDSCAPVPPAKKPTRKKAKAKLPAKTKAAGKKRRGK